MHKPKKSLGQNFLHDTNIAIKIVRLFNPQPNDVVVEIGPGQGALTSLLLEHLPHLTAIELDDMLAKELQTRFGEKLTLLHNDVLHVSWNEIFSQHQKKLRIIGNIPYYITTPILFHIIDSAAVIKNFTVMMQTEVAQRLIAKPRTKEYGILSILIQYYSTPKMLFGVSSTSFFPVPSVTSAVISLDFESPFPERAINDTFFRTIVRGTFGKRRKTLRNGLKSLGIPAEAFEQISFDFDRRPEELSVQEFVTLANQLMPYASSVVSVFMEESEL